MGKNKKRTNNKNNYKKNQKLNLNSKNNELKVKINEVKKTKKYNNFKEYIHKNKKSVIYSGSFAIILLIAYFTFFYQPNKNDIVSVDFAQIQQDTVDMGNLEYNAVDLGNNIEGEYSFNDGELVQMSMANEEVEVKEPYNENIDILPALKNDVFSTEDDLNVDLYLDMTHVPSSTSRVLDFMYEDKHIKEKVKEDGDNKELIIVADKLHKKYDIKQGLANIDIVGADDLFRSVEDSLMIGVSGYKLDVDGKTAFYFETEDEAKSVIEDLKSSYKTEEGSYQEKISLKEDINITRGKINIFDYDGFKSKDVALDYIKRGTNEQKIHIVKPGENFWVIAEDYGLSVEDLISANPDVEEKKLQIGEELSLIVSRPVINVVTTYTVNRIDPVPFPNGEDVLTDMYYEGETKVKQAGVLGEAENIVEVYMENGELVGEKVLSSNIIKEPVMQILYRGTKKAPPKKGTGTFARPTGYAPITSRFGARWGGFHHGVDIGVRYSDVYASDGGTVTFAGWKGSYGKVIFINHGANYETRYAHLSKIHVSAGENVFQGQLIATSGNTGRSTGPHLHFEIRYLGEAKNPLNYVNY